MKKLIIILLMNCLSFYLLGQNASVFFCENITSEQIYDASWGYYTSPSNLKLISEKVPVAEKAFLGNDCLELKWLSSESGDWGLAIAAPGWGLHDMLNYDSLIFWINGPAFIDIADLPDLSFEDVNGKKSDKIGLGEFVNDIDNDSTSWQKISISINEFISDESDVDFSNIKSLFFNQKNADQLEHVLWIDEIHIKKAGVSYLTYTDTINILDAENLDNSSNWETSANNESSISLLPFNGLNSNGIQIEYNLANSGWINISTAIEFDVNQHPFVFNVRPAAGDVLEIKFIDNNGSVFGKRIPLIEYYGVWQQIIIYQYSAEYWWGGDNKFDELSKIDIAISGEGSGMVWMDEIGIGKKNITSPYPPAGPVIDPNSTLEGNGFLQRRNAELYAEDPLILEYLKTIQDISSSDGLLVPSMEGNQAQTFNNALAALAFTIKNEKERAEKILDFYSLATNINNTDQYLQNFYYNGEARGFFQYVDITNYHDHSHTANRWIGDMAWLLIACKQYQFKYTSQKYESLIEIIKNLFISYFKDEGDKGYVQHGWLNGDTRLHEAFGHHEGNIDCYIAFKMCGENSYANKIKNWLHAELNNKVDLPLDLYAWRALAYGDEYIDLLDIPEYDFRYRKIIINNADSTMGFYSNADISINNFWNDGTAHMACAYMAYGDKNRGYFYANQLDKLIKEKNLGEDIVHYIPYTLNTSGNYGWVDINKGFSSAVAWYIMAKNEFNPLNYEGIASIYSADKIDNNDFNLCLYPNPTSNFINIKLNIPESAFITIDLYSITGIKLYNLYEGVINDRSRELQVPLKGANIKDIGAGLYLIKMNDGKKQITKQINIFR